MSLCETLCSSIFFNIAVYFCSCFSVYLLLFLDKCFISMSLWNPKQQVLKLARSLRRARSIELPSDNEQAVRILLDLTVSNQYDTIADLLTNSTFNVNYAFGRVRKTLLHIAANCGHYECLNVLLKRGCNPDVQDISGCTALHLAARNGQKKCVEKLLESGANPDIAGKDGATALHWLAVNGRDEIVKILLQYTKCVNLEDGQGHTALHAASRNGHTRAMECLIEAGANIDYSNETRVTPIHSACSNGQRHAISLLLSKGVKLGPNVQGQTPVDLCIMGGYGVATELLIKKSDPLMKEFVHKAIYEINISADKVNQCMKYFINRPLQLDILNSIVVESVDIGFQLLSLHSNQSSLLTNLKRSSLFLFTLSSFDEQKNFNVLHNIFSRFDGLWLSVESWLDLLHTDINSSSKNHCKDYVLCKDSNADNSKEVVNKSYDKPKSAEDNSEIFSKMAERLSAIIGLLYLCLNCQKKYSAVNHLSFKTFINKHVKVLQKIVNHYPQVIFDHFDFLLKDSSLMALFLDQIKSQPFSDRYKWFYDHLKNDSTRSFATSSDDGSFRIQRINVFEDSCSQIKDVSSETLKRNLAIQFIDEEGVGDGVLREWFSLLSNEILNPEYCLFTQSSDGCTFQPCSNSAINPDHLSYFRFAGRILGLALYHRQLVNVSFTLSFYKHLLGTKVTYHDVGSIDPEYAKNLQWILDNDVTDLGLELTFLVETDVFGVMEEIELKPGGSNISVNEKNKEEYVQLVTELRMTRAIKPQIEAFMEGFSHFIPRSLIQIFSESELDLLISGSPKTNIDEWKRMTTYNGLYNQDHPVIVWFWKCVENMNDEERGSLIQFVTGRSRLPLLIFNHSDSKFVISEITGNFDQLPTASTCMNMLKLPHYKSYNVLEEKLMLAINFGSFGYAFT